MLVGKCKPCEIYRRMCNVYIFMHEQDATQSQIQIKINKFEFRVFLLLDWLLYQGWKSSLLYNLLIAGGRIIELIVLSMVLVLCEMQGFVQDLNSSRRVHFLRRQPLHHKRFQKSLQIDRIWVCEYKPESKRQSMKRKHADSLVKKKFWG